MSSVDVHVHIRRVVLDASLSDGVRSDLLAAAVQGEIASLLAVDRRVAPAAPAPGRTGIGSVVAGSVVKHPGVATAVNAAFANTEGTRGTGNA